MTDPLWMEPGSGIDEAVKAAGSHQAVADFCTVSRQAVAQWVRQGYVPTSRAQALANRYNVPVLDLVDPVTRRLLEK